MASHLLDRSLAPRRFERGRFAKAFFGQIRQASDRCLIGYEKRKALTSLGLGTQTLGLCHGSPTRYQGESTFRLSDYRFLHFPVTNSNELRHAWFQYKR